MPEPVKPDLPNCPMCYLNGYFLRLRIKNIGKSMARDCEGKLIRILNAADHRERTDFDPTNLHWVGHKQSENTVSIHKTAYEYLDVIFVRTDNPTIIHLYTNDAEPRGITLALERADFILDVVIFGRNTDPVEKFFRIRTETARWDDVTMQETRL